MRSLQAKLEALETMRPVEMRAEWCRTFSDPPPILPPPLFRRVLAQKLQERRYGGLPAVVKRELARIAAGERPTSVHPITKKSMRPGTRLLREWQGRSIAVLVVEDGYFWEDRRYRSLSEIAREVTGVRWSGPRFFGLKTNG
jgi:hypothetical protein